MLECFLKHVLNTEYMHKQIHIGYKQMPKLLMDRKNKQKRQVQQFGSEVATPLQSLPHHSVSTGVTLSAQWSLLLLQTLISPWPSVALFPLYKLIKVQTQTQYVRQAFFAPKLLLKYQMTKNIVIWKDCPNGSLWTSQMVKRLERYWQLSKS